MAASRPSGGEKMATTVWDDPGQRVNVSGTRVTEAEVLVSGTGPREGNWVVCNEERELVRNRCRCMDDLTALTVKAVPAGK